MKILVISTLLLSCSTIVLDATIVKSAILVATGQEKDGPGADPNNNAQVVVPNESNTCSLPPVPNALTGGTGAVIDNKVFICGVVSSGEDASTICHVFDHKSWSWKSTELSDIRSAPASAPLSGALWITGGTSYNKEGPNKEGPTISSTTELVYPNSTVIPGPSLPSALRSHCMVTLENQDIMIIEREGGEVFIYDHLMGKFSKVASVNRFLGLRFTCALFKSPAHGKRPVVLVVGEVENIAAVFDYTEASEWERISDFPTRFRGGAAVTSIDGQGVYVQNYDKFYELNCATTCLWTLMSQTLPKRAYFAVMMYLPPEVSEICLKQ